VTANAIYTTSGSATLAYRVVIDGCPYEAVMLPAMERDLSVTVVAGVATAVTAGRRDGLVMRDAQFSIKADPVACKLDVGGLEIKLVDINQTWSRVFDLEPSATTWLTADMTASASSSSVAATGLFPSTGLAWADGECFAYGAKTGTTFTGTKRGVLSPDADAAQYHYITDGIRLRSPQVTNWPALWEGRRVYVYRYDEGDDLTGDGAQIYRGVITTGPRFDGTTWTLGVDHIIGVLDQTFGEDLADPVKPRGIHYTTQAPFTLNWQQGYSPALVGGVTLTGFFDDDVDHDAQWNFCDALTTALAASFAASGATGTLAAVSEGPTGWHLVYHTDAITPADLIVQIPEAFFGQRIEAPLGAWPGERVGSTTYPTLVPYGDWGYTQTVSGTVASSTVDSSPLTADKDYFFYRPMVGGPSGTVQTSLGQVPRGTWSYGDDADGRTLYLATRTPLPSDTTSVVAKGQDPDASSGYEDILAVESVDTAAVSITLAPYMRSVRRYLADALPEIRLGLSLSSRVAPLGSSIADVLDFVSANQQQYGTLGVMPMLRANDFDTAKWHATYDPLPPVNNNRLFVTFSPVSIVDIMREELKAAGCFLALDSSGKLIPARIRIPSQAEVSAIATIDEDTLLTDKALVGHEVSGLGQVNQVNYQTQYVPSKDEFGDRFIVRDVSAFGQSARTMEMPIAQKSVYLNDDTQPLTAPQVLQWVAAPVFGALAGPYAVDTVDAAKSDAVVLGEPVIFDCPYLVDGAGNDSAGYPNASRGVLGRVGIVLGKVWSAYDPRIRFTVLTTRQPIGGYAPEAIVTSHTNTSGNTWSLTLDPSYHPSGTSSADFYAAGDFVRIVQYGAPSATTLDGVVVSCVTNTLVVTFSGTWTPGGSIWYITIGDAVDVLVSQQRFCQVADSTGVVSWVDADRPAKVFAS